MSKRGLDAPRPSTLVRAYEVMSWERNPLPETEELVNLQRALAEDPENPELHKELGHLLARMGYYREACECYSRAIAIDPFNWEYYRYRAHRFISCGLFADGVADFTIASRMNPDDWNVWYHLGLGYFLLGMYEKADWAYTRCAALDDRDNSVAAVTEWHYLTLKRMGRGSDAEKLLERIRPDMQITDRVSNAYFRLLLLYKGILRPEEVFAGFDIHAGADLPTITEGFGLANYYLFNGDSARYQMILEQVVKVSANSATYSAFACLAAKVDKINLEKECAQ